MQFTENLESPGEHSLLLEGPAGQIEAVLTVPAQNIPGLVAFLGHPHSLQGGTMNNKVVTTLSRVFKELGITSLRFNFRGVGASAGTYDEGIGESEDMIALATQWKEKYPQSEFIFAGFSFGSYVTYRSAAQFGSLLLISIAPSVQHYNYQEFQPAPNPWLIVQGTEDEVVPAQSVLEFAQEAQPPIPVICFENTTHFFHGKLIELKNQLIDAIRERVPLP